MKNILGIVDKLESQIKKRSAHTLVLSRNEGESIILRLSNGEQIKISLNEYVGQQTKIGIDAPDTVLILREELT